MPPPKIGRASASCKEAAQGALAIVALYANDAHQVGYHADRHLRPEDLGLNRKFTRGGRLLVDGVTRPPGETARRLYDCLRIRQGEPNGLVFDDRMKSSAPLGSGEMQREVKRGPHQSDAENPHQRRGACETGCGQGEAAALLADQIGARRKTSSKRNCGKR